MANEIKKIIAQKLPKKTKKEPKVEHYKKGTVGYSIHGDVPKKVVDKRRYEKDTRHLDYLEDRGRGHFG